MKLDNSQMAAFHKCPWFWRERYLNKIEPRRKSDALAFGTRMHHLLQFKALGRTPLVCDAEFEPEAQVMLAAYEQKYSVEPFDVLEVERYFEVPLPGSDHIFIGKIDRIIRFHDTGLLGIEEHKTEKRGGKRNMPEAWAARPQVGLYLWAAQQLYKEPFDQILLDVLTRQSPAGREPPTFSRQHLQRSREQLDQAVANIIWVADQIEKMEVEYKDSAWWPFDGEQCAPGNFKCEYYPLHVIGRSQEVLDAQFVEAEEYLSL